MLFQDWASMALCAVLRSALIVRGIGTAHFGSEGRIKEHQDPCDRLSISPLAGPWIK